jgi:CRP-like cAMP-binding protein
MELREELLRRFPALTGSLSTAETAILLAALEPRELAARVVLLTADAASSRAYLLLRGTLDVVVDPTGAQVVMGTLEPGSFVGEVSLLDGGPTTATVVVGAPALVLGLERKSLEQLRKSSPRVAAALIRAMTVGVVGRLRRATNQLEGLRLGSAPPPAARRPSLLNALRALLSGSS